MITLAPWPSAGPGRRPSRPDTPPGTRARAMTTTKSADRRNVAGDTRKRKRTFRHDDTSPTAGSGSETRRRAGRAHVRRRGVGGPSCAPTTRTCCYLPTVVRRAKRLFTRPARSPRDRFLFGLVCRTAAAAGVGAGDLSGSRLGVVAGKYDVLTIRFVRALV